MSRKRAGSGIRVPKGWIVLDILNVFALLGAVRRALGQEGLHESINLLHELEQTIRRESIWRGRAWLGQARRGSAGRGKGP